MMKKEKFENKLVDKLFKIVTDDNLEKNLYSLNQEFTEGFFAEGSETPDNVNCMNHIEYGFVNNKFRPEELFGFKVKRKNILLSEITNWIENIPDEVKKEFPDLTPEEWSACIRIVSMILLALERYKK